MYSFSAERQKEGTSTRQTLHADVISAENSEDNAHPYDVIIRDKTESSQEQTGKKFSKKPTADAAQSGERRTPTPIPSAESLRQSARANSTAESDSETSRPYQRPILNKAATQEIIDKAVERYGRIEAGENPARPITIPQKMTEETKAMKTARTVAEAEVTPESLLPTLNNKLIEGVFDYASKKNTELVAEVKSWIGSFFNVDEAYTEWKIAAQKRTKAETIARGGVLYNNLATRSENVATVEQQQELQQKALDVIQTIAAMQHNHATALQALRSGDARYAADMQKVLYQDIARQVPQKEQGGGAALLLVCLCRLGLTRGQIPLAHFLEVCRVRWCTISHKTLVFAHLAQPLLHILPFYFPANV